MVVGTDEVYATGLYSFVRLKWPWWRRRTEGRGRREMGRGGGVLIQSKRSERGRGHDG